MEITTNIIEANSWLTKYRGANSYLYLYNIKLLKIAIMLELQFEEKVLFIICTNCEHINGRFRWRNSSIIIEENNEDLVKIIDKNAGFTLVGSGGFTLAKGLPSEFGDSFENFILK